MSDEEAFAARLRRAMEDAEIKTAAELERRWVARFGGSEANVHRQVMRLLNHTESPRPVTAQRLAELTGKPADYFTGGQPERRRSRLSAMERRLEEVSALVDGIDMSRLAETQGALGEIRDALREIEGLLESHEDRLEKLETQQPRLREQK